MTQARLAANPVTTGRRENSRLRLCLPARLTLLDRSAPCVITNISCSGAQLTMGAPPEVGEFGQISCENLDHFFDVIWREEGAVGVAFDEPVSMAMLMQLRDLNDSSANAQDQAMKALARQWVKGEVN